MRNALAILDSLEGDFNIDRDRVYIGGQSMGGYAVWDCGTRYPEQFAAAFLACGGGDENTVTVKVAQVPMWVFHSADDPTVPAARDRNMIAAMKKLGGRPKYTEFQGIGHNSWDKGGSLEPGLYPWLFAQDRSMDAK